MSKAYAEKLGRFPVRTDYDVRDIGAVAASTEAPKLLWVDPNDTPENTALENSLNAERRVQLIRVRSTADAIAMLKSTMLRNSLGLTASRFRVMSNNVREENGAPNYSAGLQMGKMMREIGYSGPILIFCGNTKRALDTWGQESHVLLTSSSRVAQSFARFGPLHEHYKCNSRDTMFPNFEQLSTELQALPPPLPTTGASIAAMTEVPSYIKEVPVEGLEGTMVNRMQAKKLSWEDQERVLTDLRAGGRIAFRKFFIPRSIVSKVNDTLASNLFHTLEDLIFQYVNVRDASCPRVDRVIAIDNPQLRSRFLAALERTEGDPDMAPWSTDADNLKYLNVLRMSIPEIAGYPRAKPALVFHATHDEAEAMICAVGFRQEFIGKTTGNDGWYGKGIYFSSFPTYCHWYQPPRSATGAVGKICVMVSWVLIGTPHAQKTKEVGRDREPHHTTHYALVHTTQPIATKPMGTKPDGDEICIFDVNAILPQFVVELNPGSPTPTA
jgi:hypothetical protein